MLEWYIFLYTKKPEWILRNSINTIPIEMEIKSNKYMRAWIHWDVFLGIHQRYKPTYQTANKMFACSMWLKLNWTIWKRLIINTPLSAPANMHIHGPLRKPLLCVFEDIYNVSIVWHRFGNRLTVVYIGKYFEFIISQSFLVGSMVVFSLFKS